MQPCNRKDICYNYPKHCELCQATSEMVNCYPCFQDKDIVKVVRCKDCKHYVVQRLECRYPRHNGIIGIDGFCSYGERKEECQ